jgi:Protein of unknown function (DUF1553)/Protein of unknown function (DUF1549)
MRLFPTKCTFPRRVSRSREPLILCIGVFLLGALPLLATPSNKAGLERYYEKFLSKELNRCTTCHLPSDVKDPESLDDFPHNRFGDRLRVLGEEWAKEGKRKDIASRLAAVALEDADGDGVDNETELLLGQNPGDDKQTPTAEQIAQSGERKAEFAKLLASYRWRPFDRVQRPTIPQPKNSDWIRTPVDAFIAAEHESRGLKPRPTASKAVLLRRVYLDLIGLSPTPDEQQAFEDDHSSDAYEKVVDRLLADPRYGERWGRHWMDIWRYSDWAGWTDGKQVRDSQRHIWRWRDWIVESLNADRGYDRMVMEMLAGDELAPEDPNTLRATGFLVRNYKMLSREQWLGDTVKHTGQAFLGITLGCAKCHDHRTEPISQSEYYRVRAIFEPHQVRTDRVPGELDREKNGLPRVYDADKDSPTYLLIRGDERRPDKDHLMQPGVPKALCGDKLKSELEIAPVKLSRDAAFPDKREFVIKETVAASERAVAQASEAVTKGKAEPNLIKQRELELSLAEAKHASLLAELRAEQLEDEGKKESDEWTVAAKDAMLKQNRVALCGAQLGLHKANGAQADAQRRLEEAAKTTDDKAKAAALEKIGKELETAAKKTAEAALAVAKAAEQSKADPTTAYKPRQREDYPTVSTGRRLAFSRWIANADNPLTARVAMNHLWLRHFGRGIVATPENFGSDGARPSHPALLDWLAAEFMSKGWQMKSMHRMIVTSNTYRMSSTPDETDAAADLDNIYLWRMPTRRMEAELVRDNLLYACGSLDLTAGGPDIDHLEGLKSKRRSIYLRSAAEKEVEFLKIFDGPSVNECYQRHPTVMPQQSLALANGELTLAQSKLLAKQLSEQAKESDEGFVQGAFQRVLARVPRSDELTACVEFLRSKTSNPGVANATEAAPVDSQSPANLTRARENLVHVLFNHNDFVTIR